MMGAAYVVTGSVNQACLESGASEHTRKLLSQTEMTDVAMGPRPGICLKWVLRCRCSNAAPLFAMRAQKLYDLYSRYDTWQDVPQKEREKLETSVFKRSFDDIWVECVKFFSERDPHQVETRQCQSQGQNGAGFPLVPGGFLRAGPIAVKKDVRWITRSGAARPWAPLTIGCATPTWRRLKTGTLPDVNLQILSGAAYLQRLRLLGAQGLRFNPAVEQFLPLQALI